VLLIFIHAGLPFAGIRPTAFVSVCLAFLLNNSAYYGEIYRAGIESVGAGQWDAARSTGLRASQALAYVVLPQAVRNVLPDLVSNTVEVVKLTSIASVVALPELLYSADMARSVTFNSSPIVLAAAIYLALLWPVVRLISRLERRIAARKRLISALPRRTPHGEERGRSPRVSNHGPRRRWRSTHAQPILRDARLRYATAGSSG